ncbi:MAG: FAD-dependent oxidoreductase [Aminobacteriaceae bacterium]
MSDIHVDVVVVGAGPAGVAAGIGAREAGAGRVLVIERDWDLGGILQQCIHPGFGLHTFKEELTGPEYMHRWVRWAHDAGVEFMTNTMVFGAYPDGSLDVMNPDRGVFRVSAGATLLAMGCRERPLGAVNIPGTRPAGIYTAGTAQRFVNMEGYMPGERAVIMGSGDIGLIMARRMIWEGAKVEAVFEIMPWAGGLRRNIAQCLDDYGIPFFLQHSVARVHGRDRLEGVTAVKVDDDRRPLPGSERFIPCDTLLLAVGLIPENELSRMAGAQIHPVTGGPVINELYQTTCPSIFAAGNVVIVYDLADWVSQEGMAAGRNAALYATGRLQAPVRRIEIAGGANVRLFSPHYITGGTDATIYFRVNRPIEGRCRVFASHGLYERRERYARPGEMNEVRLKKDALAALPDGATRIVVDVEEA